ncbi:MAG: translation elongation factor Ts [Bdellovibrionaceae bacterium]|nr:translation elongation factor Ts [Pseudobdellovibrionaceae bacterium]
MTSAQEVKKLRQKTGAGFMDCKKALESCDNDLEKALIWLKKKGLSTVAKKSGRKAVEGLIFSYIHGNGRLGVLLEVNSETDFVARNEKFKNFVKQLSLHILAMEPLYIKENDIPEELKVEEKKVFNNQALLKSKKPEIAQKISEGLYKKWLEEICLLNQEFVRENQESKQTIEKALNELISQLGENIVIRRFVRFALGETHEEKKNGPA